jgi:hypothetical protein
VFSYQVCSGHVFLPNVFRSCLTTKFDQVLFSYQVCSCLVSYQVHSGFVFPKKCSRPSFPHKVCAGPFFFYLQLVFIHFPPTKYVQCSWLGSIPFLFFYPSLLRSCFYTMCVHTMFSYPDCSCLAFLPYSNPECYQACLYFFLYFKVC